MVKKNKGGGIIPSGNFPAQALCETPCGKKILSVVSDLLSICISDDR